MINSDSDYLTNRLEIDLKRQNQLKHFLDATRDFNHRNRRVFTQKLIEELLRNSNIIHQSSKCIKSIYCE